MKLGKFSVSLTVKDIKKSKAFYEQLGFSVVAGEEKENWLILSNEQSTIGLFQGIFDKNILTFNPGWDSNGKEMNNFTDVRQLQEQLKEQGIKFDTEADTQTQGPASFTIKDPDGNPILVDQHVKNPNFKADEKIVELERAIKQQNQSIQQMQKQIEELTLQIQQLTSQPQKNDIENQKKYLPNFNFSSKN